MWEEWEQRYSNHLPPHFNDLSLNETKYNISIYQTAWKNKAKPYQCISNHKAKLITFFNLPGGTLEIIFKVNILAHLKVGG